MLERLSLLQRCGAFCEIGLLLPSGVGKRLTLPVSEVELVRTLGVPQHRRKDY